MMSTPNPLDARVLPAGGWRPRDYQMKAWTYLEQGGKRAVLVWPRRHGKDELALHWTAVSTQTKVGTYWHMLPEASQARKAIWEAVNPHTGRRRIDEVFPQWMREVTREQEMLIRFTNGSTWQVVGSDNYDRLVGASPVGVVFSEWALADPEAWAFVRPMLAENGGWALFVTTPRGNNHAKRTLEMAMSEPAWFGELFTARDTGVFSAEMLDTELRENISQYGPDDGKNKFEQEYLCSFTAANPGAIYAHWIDEAEKEERITEVPIDYRYQVQTCWDLGMNDATAIWFYQDVGFQTRFLHAYSNSGEDLQHYVDYIKDWCAEHKVAVGTGILPHDVEVRELGTGRSRKEVLQSLGLNVRVAPNLRIPEQIQATRDMLKTAWFDAKECEKGLESLRHFHYERNERTRVFSSRPKHDWSSHFCFSPDTLVTTRMGVYAISQLPQSGEVMTLCGWKPYTNPRMTRSNARVVEVAFSDGTLVKCTPDHMFMTDNGWKSADQLQPGSKIRSLSTEKLSILQASFTALGRRLRTFLGAAEDFIGTLGRRLLDQSRKTVMCTIGMATLPTTELRTWSAWTGWNISGTRNAYIERSTQSPTRCAPSQNSGTKLKPGKLGTKNFTSAQSTGRERKLWKWIASCAGLSFRLTYMRAKPKSFAAIIADTLSTCTGAAKRGSKYLVKRLVSNVANLCKLGTRLLRTIAGTNTVQNPAEPSFVTVKSLRESGTSDVWCLTVPDAEHFTLANGAVVHNCSALAYRAVSGYEAEMGTYFGARKAKPLKQPDKWI